LEQTNGLLKRHAGDRRIDRAGEPSRVGRAVPPHHLTSGIEQDATGFSGWTGNNGQKPSVSAIFLGQFPAY
jgi:hypothetical protein